MGFCIQFAILHDYEDEASAVQFEEVAVNLNLRNKKIKSLSSYYPLINLASALGLLLYSNVVLLTLSIFLIEADDVGSNIKGIKSWNFVKLRG